MVRERKKKKSQREIKGKAEKGEEEEMTETNVPTLTAVLHSLGRQTYK